VAGKIFISYRREDTAANALGVSQYLEKEFGRNNVFIDVDMHAGARFASVLEQRLAKCKIMLVLIGPDWLNAANEQGQRRLDADDDWVHLEIARALSRDITVVPVLVGGATLPPRAELPEDIRGLLDHQAISITISGFRHQMAGLVRDIRAVPDATSWRRLLRVPAALLLLLIALALISISLSPDQFEGIREMVIRARPPVPRLNDAWSSPPGEWALYGVDKQPVAYYLKPDSILVFNDDIAYTARYPFKRTPMEQMSFESAYQDDTLVIDCKRSVFGLSEKTIYNRAGEVISHYKKGDPETLDLTSENPIQPGSVLATAAYLLCSERVRSFIVNPAATSVVYLSPTPNGDSELYHSPPIKISDGIYETFVTTKFHQDRLFSDLFPGQEVVGLPRSYRSIVLYDKLDCFGWTLETSAIKYLDSEDHLESVAASLPTRAIDVKDGSPLGFLLAKVCGVRVRNVRGKYEGTNSGTYKMGGAADQKIVIVVEQTGTQLTVSFETPNGGQGKGTGILEGNIVKGILLKSSAPSCSGSYEASLEFDNDDLIKWSYKGQDCGGPIEGQGTATKTKV